MLKGSLLELAIGRGEGGGTFGVAVPQVPEHTATDNGRQIDPIGETATVFLIGQKVCRQRQATLDQYQQIPQSPRRNGLPMERLNRSLVMPYEYLAWRHIIRM